MPTPNIGLKKSRRFRIKGGLNERKGRHEIATGPNRFDHQFAVRFAHEASHSVFENLVEACRIEQGHV